MARTRAKATMRAAWARATSRCRATFPVSSWIGRTVASRTSMTRLDFSSMTPIRIHVLYCESITKMRMRPNITVPGRRPSALLGEAADCAPARAWREPTSRPGGPRGAPRRGPRSPRGSSATARGELRGWSRWLSARSACSPPTRRPSTTARARPPWRSGCRRRPDPVRGRDASWCRCSGPTASMADRAGGRAIPRHRPAGAWCATCRSGDDDGRGDDRQDHQRADPEDPAREPLMDLACGHQPDVAGGEPGRRAGRLRASAPPAQPHTARPAKATTTARRSRPLTRALPGRLPTAGGARR